VIVSEIRTHSVRLMFQDLEHASSMQVWRSEIFDEREERGANE